jgi:hypothetical protein
MLDERVRRVVKLPESEETDRSDLERMLSIMLAYRERRFLRGLGCECERKNDLHGIGDEVFLGKPRMHTQSHLSRWESGLGSRRSPRAVNSRGMFGNKSVASVGKSTYLALFFIAYTPLTFWFLYQIRRERCTADVGVGSEVRYGLQRSSSWTANAGGVFAVAVSTRKWCSSGITKSWIPSKGTKALQPVPL